MDWGPMALGAPWFACPGMQKPGANALTGRSIGGCCQLNPPPAQYAHAVPPFWNCGGRIVLVQRAYFSACRMVFDVPSGMSAGMRVLPWAFVLYGVVVMSFCATTRAL